MVFSDYLIIFVSMEIKYSSLQDVRSKIKDVNIWIDISDGSRLYFKGSDGFTFIQVNRVSYILDSDFWDKDTQYEILLHGIAYWDGIRHLHFGDESSDNLGYFYYPILPNIIEVLNILSDLEDKYCKKD